MMPKSKKIFPGAALTAVAILCSCGTAGAGGLDQFVGFGDSTLDSGYFRYHTTGSPAADAAVAAAIAAGANGGWAGNGIMDTTTLAGKFGLSAAPIDGGGTNYANGGSLTASLLAGTVPLTVQISNYLSSVNGVANPNALYIISSGNNDLTHSSGPDFLSQQASALAASVAALQKAGARILLVPNSFRYANLAGLGGEITDNSNAAEYLRLSAYNTERWADLTSAGVHFIPADLDSVFKYVVKHPTAFGFTASSVLAANAPSSVAAILSVLTDEQQQTYLFVDGKHLTTAGQTIEADYMYSLLTAPGEIALLAENAIQDGLSRNATIQRQVELSGRNLGQKGVHGWIAAGVNYSSTEVGSHLPSDSGNPFQGTVGADYRTASGFILGGALSAGHRSQDFSTGGNFAQNEQAMSLYSSYESGQFWGNAVATYGFLQNDINRSVQLGIFTDRDNGDASGSTISLALRGGRDFKIGQFTTGPVLGAVFQKAHIDGFTETGTTGVTALSFDSQTRDSQLTQLGWRGSVELGDWKPFAEAAWNHEWNDDDRRVTAALTTVAVPAFTSLATEVASDWGTASIGASYQLNSKTMLWGVFSAVYANAQSTNYGGELGLSVSF